MGEPLPERGGLRRFCCARYETSFARRFPLRKIAVLSSDRSTHSSLCQTHDFLLGELKIHYVPQETGLLTSRAESDNLEVDI